MAEPTENQPNPQNAANARKAFLLRIDPVLWAQLESWAAADLRSINGQVEWILRQAVETRKGKSRG